MKAYCINMDWRPDRLQHMQDQFARFGRSFERVAGVEAKDPVIAAAAAASPPGMTGLQISAGVHANFQSHRKAWRRMLATGDSHAMVMEDDLIFAPGFAAYLDEGWMPEDADIVRLETFLHRTHLGRKPSYPAGGRTLQRLRARHVGTACYVLSARIARFLLDETEVVSDPADEALFNERSPLFHRIVTYQMTPAPAIQGNLIPENLSNPLWAAGSITERFAGGAAPPADRPETQVARVRRRLTEEARALHDGTRYVLVPFG
jgi:glycosyl transferase, family 25